MKYKPLHDQPTNKLGYVCILKHFEPSFFAFSLQLFFEKLLIPKNLQRITLKSPQKIMQAFMRNISYHNHHHHHHHRHSDVQTGFCPLPDVTQHSKNLSCCTCVLTSLLNSRLVCCSCKTSYEVCRTS